MELTHSYNLFDLTLPLKISVITPYGISNIAWVSNSISHIISFDDVFNFGIFWMLHWRWNVAKYWFESNMSLEVDEKGK